MFFLFTIYANNKIHVKAGVNDKMVSEPLTIYFFNLTTYRRVIPGKSYTTLSLFIIGFLKLHKTTDMMYYTYNINVRLLDTNVEKTASG